MAKDITGLRVGKLLVLRRDGQRGNRAVWLCACDCGRTTRIRTSRLIRGETQSCGCLRLVCSDSIPRADSTKPYQVDMVGQRIGRWLVLSYGGFRLVNKRRRHYWVCRCDCGKETSVQGDSLRRKATQSCGCLMEDTPSRLLPDFLGAKRRIYARIRSGAERREIPFSLSFEECLALIDLPCFYCGAAPSNRSRRARSNAGSKRVYSYSGLDRRDSDFGYATDNVVPCCKTCNVAKNVLSEDEFFMWTERAYLFQVQRRQAKEVAA